MNYKDFNVNISYISCGKENITDSFLKPLLKETKIYQRSVGFFSSSVLEPIFESVVKLAENKGKIQLIASPKLSEDDIEAINKGYEKREEIINNKFTDDFINIIDSYDDNKLNLLSNLIASDILDLKIAVTDTYGIYHDKLGIMEDFDGNTIVFYGSPNSSLNAYQNNYEKIRVVKGWIYKNNEIVEDEKNEFQSLWNGTNPFVKVYSYKESAKSNILKILKNRKKGLEESKEPIILRDYQEDAINAWIENKYHGFYVMATGTGKTWTAIYSAKRLIEKHRAMIVISAPYKHLVRQWADDIVKAFPKAKIIMVSSENSAWEEQLSNEIIRKKYNPDNQIIVISTIASFKKDRFLKTLLKSTENKLLIVDEAHRFTDRSDDIKIYFKYILGLSATPFSGTSAQKGLELMNFFGGQVFSLTIEEALERNFLVPYYYYPIYVHSTNNEEKQFEHFTKNIMSCFKNNICINPDLLVKSLRNRLRIISMSEEKQNRIDEIITSIPEKDHFVVYCGDGKIFDGDIGKQIRHIQSIKKVLTRYEYKVSQFTAAEDMNDRMNLVDAFNKKEIDALVAIRCLDEGINIPSIRSALILSSNDDYREFVQRRGRILRLYNGKEYANIYDVIVLPSRNLSSWAKIEFRRYYEYAKLAQNRDTLLEDLEDYLFEYGLTMDDVDVYDYDNVEVYEENE